MRGFLIVLGVAVAAGGTLFLLSSDGPHASRLDGDTDVDGPVLLGGAVDDAGATDDAEALGGRVVPGVVVDHEGHPVAGVLVRVIRRTRPLLFEDDIVGRVDRAFRAPFRPESLPISATSGDDGTFRLVGLPEGDDLLARADVGADQASTTVPLSNDGAARIRVLPATPLPVDVPLDATLVLRADGVFHFVPAERAPASVPMPDHPIEAALFRRGVRMRITAALRDTPIDSSAASARVLGQVRSTSGEPVPRARLVLVTGQGRFARGLPRGVGLAKSGADGAYVMDEVVPGNVKSLWVVADGYVPQVVAVEGLPIGVGQEREFDVVLQRGATVRGVVTASDGEPVVGATVQLTNDTIRTRLTDARGRFRFDGVELGDLELLVSATGQFQQRPPLEVTLADVTKPLDVTIPMRPGVGRAGQVLLPSGAPAGAGVRVFTRHAAPKLETLTDASGCFLLPLRKGRPYQFAASQGALRSAWTERWIHVPGREDPPLALQLHPTARIEGRVLTDDDEPVEGIPVGLGGIWLDVRSDGEGRFVFERLLAGSHVVYVEDKAADQLLARGPSSHVELELGWGDDVLDVVLRCTDRSHLSGVVLDAAGVPMAGVQVSTESTDAGWIHANPGGMFETGDHGASTTTDAGGRFRIPALFGGEFEYRFEVEGLPVDGTWQAPDDDVRLEPGKALGRILEGRVVFPDGRPVPSALIEMEALRWEEEENWQDWTYITDLTVLVHDGVFRVALPTETKAVRLDIDEILDGAGRPLGALPFRHGEEEQIELTDEPIRIEVEMGRSYEGQVVDENGAGVAGISVGAAYAQAKGKDAYWDEGSRLATSGSHKGTFSFPGKADHNAVTDASGHFRFEGLHDEPIWIRTRAFGPYGSTGPVEIADRSKPVRIQLERAAAISGHVLGPDGEPLSGAGVLIKGVAELETDDEGRFHQGGLDPTARVTIVVETFGSRLGTQIHDVAAGTSDVEIRLVAGAMLEGQVVDPSGKSVYEGMVRLTPVGEDDDIDRGSLDPLHNRRFRIGPVPPGEYEVRLTPGWGDPIDVFQRKTVRVTLPGPALTLVVERTWEPMGTSSGLAPPDPNVVGGPFALRWVPDEPIEVPADGDYSPFGMNTRNEGYVAADGTWSISRVREPDGRLFAVVPPQNRYALLRARRGQGPFALRFVEGQTVAGKVTGGNGATPLRLRQDGLEIRFSSQADGAFQVGGVPPGRWMLSKAPSPWQDDTNDGPELEVAAGQTDVAFALGQPPR